MGSSESKESKETTNSGVLNGNEFSASAKVVNHIDLELSRLEVLQIIAIILKASILLLILMKMLIKYIKREENKNRRIEQMAMRNA